ncbi:MAG: hypothetical protein J6K70_02600 [Selenomonadales bacterium]|nr:hypothetical protein [Selenomonadales bacterium]
MCFRLRFTVRDSPIIFATARFLGRYRMGRISQSASSYRLASWMRLQQRQNSHHFVRSNMLTQTVPLRLSTYYFAELQKRPNPL